MTAFPWAEATPELAADSVDTTPRWKRISAGLLALWLLCSPSGLVFAGPVADAAAAANQRPTLTTTGTGLPLVNIAAPNAAGQSYNRYQRLDVDPVGLILNNSRTAGVTALGDPIAANPNLSSRTANLIVNEVVSALPSQLNGPLAIFGDAAQLVIANPNGITCSGCAFLNTSHVTLSTGQVRWLTAPNGDSTSVDNAAVIGFTVSRGQILVTGSGLASPLARLDLIAQTLNINAPIDVGSGALNLLAGRQSVEHLTLAQSASDPTNSRADSGGDWAIDATVFGAMNAGTIHIVSTDAGMGVRCDRALAATTGDLFINANGDLALKSVGAAQNLALSTSGTLTHAGMGANGNLTVAADTLNNAGQHIIAQGDVRLTAPQFDNSGGQVLAGGLLNVTATASQLDLAAGTLAGAGGLEVQAQALSNSGTFAHAAAVTLTAATVFTNSGTLRSNGAVTIQAGTAFINSGSLLGHSLALGAGGTLTNSGTLLALNDAVLAGGGFINSGVVAADQDLALMLGTSVVNADGLVQAGRDLSVTSAATGHLGGTIAAVRDLVLNFGDYTHAPGGTHETRATHFRAGRDLTVNATHLTNADLIDAWRDLKLNISGRLSNSGQLLSGRDLRVTAGTLTNTAGVIEATRDLSITADTLINQRGPLTKTHTHWGDTQPPGSVNCRSDHGYCESWAQGEATPAALLSAGRNLDIDATGRVTNQGSLITAGGDATITADRFDNTARTLTTRWHGHWGEWQGGVRRGYTWKNDWGTTVSGHTPATVEVAGTLDITAASQSNSGNLRSGSLWLGGATISNGLHDYTYQTPDSTLPGSQIALAGTPLPALSVPAGGTYTPQGATFFTSASRLALLSLPPATLNALLPPDLRPSGTTHLLDGWLEEQAIRQAALGEAGRASFLASNDPKQERATLYQNAAQYARANHIPLGVTLSEAQIAALSEPILWYVEQEVTGPDGQAHRVLVPRLYLPDSTRHDLASIAGGTLRANDIAIKASDRVDNSGFIVAGRRLNVEADTLINQKRSADVTNGGPALRQYLGNVGYWETTGSTVQPGGFMSAANLNLDVGRLQAISGEFVENGQDATTRLQQQLGSRFTQSQNQDKLQQVFVTMQKKDGMASIAVLVVAMVVAYFTAGAASELIGMALADGAAAAGSTFAAATATASAGFGNIVLTAGLAGMASNATTQLLSTGKLNAGQMFKSGATSALTAGLTHGITVGPNGLGFNASTPASALSKGTQTLNQYAGIQDVAATGAKLARFDLDTLSSHLVGMAGRGLIKAGINTAAYGGSFGTAFRQSVISDLQAVGASAIGQHWGGGQAPATQTAMHATLGATAAKLQGQEAMAGAIGAATESVLGNLVDAAGSFDTSDSFDKTLYTASAMLAGGAAAQAAGRDGVTAATAAQNAADNNFLGRIDQKRLMGLRAKKNLTDAQKLELTNLEQADQQSDFLLGKARRGEALSDNDRSQLDASLYRYAQQEGPPAASALVKFGAPNTGNYTNAFALNKYQAEYNQKAQDAGLGRSNFRSPSDNESFASWLSTPFTPRPSEEIRYNQIIAEQGGAAARQNSFNMQAARNVQDGLALAGPGAFFLHSLKIGSTVLPYLTEKTGMTAEAIALNAVIGGATSYASAKLQNKSDTVTAAQTVWGMLSPSVGAAIAQHHGNTLTAALGAGAFTGLAGNFLTQTIEITREGKPFSFVDLMTSTGVGAANSGYIRFMTQGLSPVQKNNLGTQFGVNVSNPVPWLDVVQSKILDAHRASSRQSGTNGDQ